VSYPPEPNNPFDKQPPQQPYGYPQQPPFPQPPFPQQQGHPGYPGPAGYPQGGGVPGMPPFASWGARLGAALLDYIIVGLLPTILSWIGQAQFAGAFVTAINDCANNPACTNPAPPSIPASAVPLVLIGVLLSLAGGLWLCYREGVTGQTPGKKALGISVLREIDGQPLGFGLALGRRLLHIVDGIPCYLGYLWPLWDAKKQTFADKIVHTVVVKR
jgi:uncharacterized RDD family membrane protein YckC